MTSVDRLLFLESDESIFGDVVTGIAILRAPRDIDSDVTSVAFGCIAQRSGTGGAGVVTQHGERRKQVRLLQHSGVRRVFAGSMLASDRCSEPLQTRAVLNSSGNDVTSHSSTVFSLFFFVLCVLKLGDMFAVFC